jgi:hypothetical protein
MIAMGEIKALRLSSQNSEPSYDPESTEIRARRNKLLEALNNGASKQTRQAEIAFEKYLDNLYPETVHLD